jgi:hypothetical protein
MVLVEDCAGQPNAISQVTDPANWGRMIDDSGPDSFVGAEDPAGTTLVTDGSRELEPPLYEDLVDWDDSNPSSENGDPNDELQRFSDDLDLSGSGTAQTDDADMVLDDFDLSGSETTHTDDADMVDEHPSPYELPVPGQTEMLDARSTSHNTGGAGFDLDDWNLGSYHAGDRLNLRPDHNQNITNQEFDPNQLGYTNLPAVMLQDTQAIVDAFPTQEDTSYLGPSSGAQSIEDSSSQTAHHSSLSLDGAGASQPSPRICKFHPAESFRSRGDLMYVTPRLM